MLRHRDRPGPARRRRQVRGPGWSATSPGDLEEDAFRIFRLNNGIYGQRQGGHNQMVRVKVPYGSACCPTSSTCMADLADNYSRGWGHITTRQNIQFHFVQLEKIPEVMRLLAPVGLTTREACGDTVRNVQGCHLAGACPLRGARHHARGPRPPTGTSCATRWASACPASSRSTSRAAPPTAARPCSTTSASSACSRTLEDGTVERGFRVFVAGGLGANPHPALALEEFTSREELLPTIEAVLRVFNNHGNRDNKLRARMKWLVDTMGWDEVQERIIKERRLLLGSSSWPGGIPDEVEKAGDAPAGRGRGRHAHRRWARARRVDRQGQVASTRWDDGQRRAGRGQGHGLRHGLRPARRHHQRPVPGPAPASSASSASRCGSPTGRTSCSAASPRSSCPPCTSGWPPSAWTSPAPSWRATSSPARAPTPATWP